MSSRLTAVAFDAHDPARLARFWGDLLGREPVEDGSDTTLPAAAAEVGLRFVASVVERVGPALLHLHLTSTSPQDQQRRVAIALRLGARHLDVGQRPEERHVVLADPEGNEFCLIEPGNTFLAGCGLLGEVACDGTRDVGLFWSEALGWPLVWDRDQETAIQSPAGGTKIAWGGPPLTPRVGVIRQRLRLAPVDGDIGTEVARLVDLGATRVGIGDDGATAMSDPDGNPFLVASS